MTSQNESLPEKSPMDVVRAYKASLKFESSRSLIPLKELAGGREVSHLPHIKIHVNGGSLVICRSDIANRNVVSIYGHSVAIFRFDNKGEISGFASFCSDQVLVETFHQLMAVPFFRNLIIRFNIYELRNGDIGQEQATITGQRSMIQRALTGLDSQEIDPIVDFKKVLSDFKSLIMRVREDRSQVRKMGSYLISCCKQVLTIGINSTELFNLLIQAVTECENDDAESPNKEVGLKYLQKCFSCLFYGFTNPNGDKNERVDPTAVTLLRYRTDRNPERIQIDSPEQLLSMWGSNVDNEIIIEDKYYRIDNVVRRSGTPELFPQILEMIGTEERWSRLMGLYELMVTIDSQAATPHLLEGLKSERGDVRRAAVRKMPNNSQLISCLLEEWDGEDDLLVRNEVIDKLRIIGDPIVIPFLMKVFMEYRRERRGEGMTILESVIEALGSCSFENSSSEGGSIIGDDYRYLMSFLGRLLRSKEWQQRLCALHLLKLYGSLGTIWELEEIAFRDKESQVRREAWEAISSIFKRNGIKLNKDESVKSLGDSGDTDYDQKNIKELHALWKRAKSTVGVLEYVPGLKASTARALDRIDCPYEPTTVLDELINNQEYRSCVISEFGCCDNPEVITVLIDALEDGSEDVAHAAILGVIKMGRQVIPALLRIILDKSKRRELRSLIITKILKKTAETQDVPYLEEAYLHANYSGIKWKAREAIREVVLRQGGIMFDELKFKFPKRTNLEIFKKIYEKARRETGLPNLEFKFTLHA
jgi:HEAT repeat protein